MAATLASLGIRPDGPCFVIAEAGVNHDGDVATALALVESARTIGVDCLKFQTFGADRVAVADAPKAAYQLRTTDGRESQLAMLRRLELSPDGHRVVAEACRRAGVRFLSTPYDLEDAEFLASLGVGAFKLASIHLVELPFLRDLARFRLPLILSTGMATLAEIEAAVETLRDAGLHEFCLLQCTTNYPSRVEDANLRAMATMAAAFGVPVGYSDHTEGLAVPLAAVALGARVLEKHFTLDRSRPGPDHACSSDPAEFAALIAGVRAVEAALGTGIKRPSAAETANRSGMRRSVVLRSPLAAGTVLERGHLAFKRPGTGLAPAMADLLVGRRLRRDLPADAPLALEDVA